MITGSTQSVMSVIYFCRSSVYISCRFRMDMDHSVQSSVLLQQFRISSAPCIILFSSLQRKCYSTVAVRTASPPLRLPCSCTESPDHSPDLLLYLLPSPL